MNKNLSKTRFGYALSCETKAYYDANKETYAKKEPTNREKFGLFQGNQFGELVKFWFKKKESSAIEIESVREEQQIEETLSLLKKDKITIFEATLKYNNLIIRVDVLQKIGNLIKIIEAKVKGYDKKKEKYKLPDIAFQSYVTNLIFPNYEIEPYLLFLDKDHTIKFDGLSQLIGDFKKNGNSKVKIKDEIKLKELETLPFKIINVKDKVKNIQDEFFTSKIKKLSELLAQGLKPTPKLTNKCCKCEFYQSPNVTSNLKSGWHECMSNFFKESSNIERKDSIFGFFDSKKIDQDLLSHNVLAMKSLPSINTNSIKTTQGIINLKLRQNLQLLESKNEIKKIFLEVSIVKELFNKWKYPLHFIDFETTRPPLPYFRNRRPYEIVLFQFSHHMIHENGKIEHKTEKIIAKPNVNPNFIILDELVKALNNDAGTILHWSHHERTTLNEMLQAAEKENIKNFDYINLFCKTLGVHKESKGRLFDFSAFFNNYVYVPGSASSSMKKLLPALLKNSTFLKEKYQKPIYGTDIMPSHNFKNKVWYIEKNNSVKNPYELLDEDENVSDGGEAMIAFDQLQKEDLDNHEREKLEKQLKKYCELDTLGMVMAYEAIKSNFL